MNGFDALGQFFVDISRLHEGAESFVRAAHLAPDDFEAVFNAATTLREIKEMDQAEHFYRLAVRLRPDVCASFVLLNLVCIPRSCQR